MADYPKLLMLRSGDTTNTRLVDNLDQEDAALAKGWVVVNPQPPMAQPAQAPED